MTCQPALSHAAPLVPLARAMTERGHQVTVATSGPYAAVLGDHGLPVSAVGPEFRVREGDPVYERTVGARLFFGFLDLARGSADDLIGLARTTRADLIVREYAEFGGWLAARSLGLPLVTQGIMHRLPPPAVERILAELGQQSAERGIAPPADDRELHGELYLDVVPRSFRLPWERDGEHIASITPSTFDGAVTSTVPPWLRSTGEGRPLVYVTLGTIFTRYPAVWRVIVEAVRDLDADVLMTIGPETDRSLIGSTPGHVRIERFVPQSQVLPRASAVICHAGFSTLIGAFRAGVPAVCLPVHADQPLNARACAAAGAGVNAANAPGDTRGAMVEPATLTASAVRAALDAVLAESAYRQAAARIGEEVRRMPAAAEVVETIERRVLAAAVA